MIEFTNLNHLEFTNLNHLSDNEFYGLPERIRLKAYMSTKNSAKNSAILLSSTTYLSEKRRLTLACMEEDLKHMKLENENAKLRNAILKEELNHMLRRPNHAAGNCNGTCTSVPEKPKPDNPLD